MLVYLMSIFEATCGEELFRKEIVGLQGAVLPNYGDSAFSNSEVDDPRAEFPQTGRPHFHDACMHGHRPASQTLGLADCLEVVVALAQVISALSGERVGGDIVSDFPATA